MEFRIDRPIRAQIGFKPCRIWPPSPGNGGSVLSSHHAAAGKRLHPAAALVAVPRTICLYMIDMGRTKPYGIRATALGASGDDLLEDVLVCRATVCTASVVQRTMLRQLPYSVKQNVKKVSRGLWERV